MRITAEDLWLVNADSTDIAKLNKVLDYVQTAMPVNGKTAIEQLAGLRDVRIEINHVGAMKYDPGAKIIHWDPDMGMVVRGAEGELLGVNSSAVVLLHEVNHALDENIQANLAEKNEKFDNNAERLATQRTNAAAAEAGEAERPNHGGELIYAPDPTEHTEQWENFDGRDSSGGRDMVWIEQDTIMNDVFGDVFEMSDLMYGMPDFGFGGNSPFPLWPEETPNLVASMESEQVTAEAADAGVALIGVASLGYLHAEFMYQ